MREATCISESVYAPHLTRGKRYEIIQFDALKRQIRIKGDDNRTRWLPFYCFDFENRPVITLQSYSIDDTRYMMEDGFTEVTVTCSTGELRWCIFMTPEALAKSGDWIPDTKIPFHYDNKHLIIVNELRPELIEKVLRYIDTQNKLIECTLPLENLEDKGTED